MERHSQVKNSIFSRHSQLPYRILVLLTCLTFVSACATWKQHDVEPGRDDKYSIVLLPIQVTAEVGQLSDIVSASEGVDDEKSRISMLLSAEAERLDGELQEKLGRNPYFYMLDMGHSIPVPRGMDGSSTEQPWPAKDLARYRKHYGVQAILQVNLAGYGELKREWISLLIGTGVVEGVIEGVVVAKAVNNNWVGLAVALEEIGQEILTWGGGAYLFNSYYSPVTIEAKLISTADGEVVWRDTIFVASDKEKLKAYPEPERNRREVQLEVTADRAIDDLVKDLDKVAKRNLQSSSDDRKKGRDPELQTGMDG